MGGFPKNATIEATLFGQRMDSDSAVRIATLSKRLRGECPEFPRIIQAAMATVVEALERGVPFERCLSVFFAYMLQVGVTSERARAECEQLQDAMNPRQLTEGRQPPCDKDSCNTIT